MTDCAGIIAAGHGERLRRAYPDVPKPLVPVHGVPIVDWVADGLVAAGASSLVVIVNGRGGRIVEHLASAHPSLSIETIVRDTASSYESFYHVCRRLSATADRFLVSTVDALLPGGETERFAAEAFRSFPGGEQPVAALATTGVSDDEKPLLADADASGRVTALGPRAATRTSETCGLYALRKDAVDRMPSPASFGRLRDFWIDLVDSGAPVRAVSMPETADLDRPEDLAAAERVLTCSDA